MRIKIVNPKKIVAAFSVLGVLLISANFVFSQCGNYFKNRVELKKLVVGDADAVPMDDWTGDGKPDFWIAQWNPARSAYDFLIYPTRPTGYWDWDNPIVLTSPINDFQYYRAKEILDFDSDGDADIIFPSGLNGFKVYRNTGTSLTPLPEFSDPDNTTFGSYRIAFTDLNNDNFLDWVYWYRNPSTQVLELRSKLQNPDGTFSNRNIILTGSAENGFANYLAFNVGDFNGDDKVDIVYNSYYTNIPNKYVIVKNLGDGNFEVGTPVAEPDFNAGGTVRDFNNDGKDDIMIVAPDGIIIYYAQANGTFSRSDIPGFVDGSPIPAELNGDNNLDIIQIGSGSYGTYINNGSGGFTYTYYPRNFGLPTSQWAVADFSGDGKADFYDKNTSSWVNRTYNIFREELVMVRENVCQSLGETKSVNFDGNQYPDVSVWNPDSGKWSSKNARWYPYFDPDTRIFNWGLGVHGDVPAPGDYDGDGKTDYAVYRNSTGNWYILKSSDSSWLVFPFGLPGDVAVPNDYDGGGKTDIAVWRPSSGIWYIWFSETQSFGALHFGAAGDKPVPADYDGDGKTDLALYRPSEGNWYYLRSSDLTYVVLHWGNQTDIPLPADFDGDMRADVAIYRDGFWWIWRSSNNQYAVVQWGQPGDVPMPVYYNLVSADFVLYRPSNNTWHSFGSRSTPVFSMGGSGDAPVRFGLPNN